MINTVYVFKKTRFICLYLFLVIHFIQKPSIILKYNKFSKDDEKKNQYQVSV